MSGELERLIHTSGSGTILDLGLPGWLKVSLKTILAVPFTLHSFNGIRHLMWDMGYGQSTLPVPLVIIPKPPLIANVGNL